jgi:hypothetical protein
MQNSNEGLDIKLVSPPKPDDVNHRALMGTDASDAYPKSAEIFNRNRRFIPGGRFGKPACSTRDRIRQGSGRTYLGRRWESVH